MPIGREELGAYLRLRRYGKPVTVRSFQRLVGYSSPGQAKRMLKKLERLGLIEKTQFSKYVARDNLPPEFSAYLVIKSYLIPRMLIYVAYATTVTATYIILARPPLPAIALLISLIAPYWIEAVTSIKNIERVAKEGVVRF
jgi:hypothetical protein